jgi:hypothetical protein
MKKKTQFKKKQMRSKKTNKKSIKHRGGKGDNTFESLKKNTIYNIKETNNVMSNNTKNYYIAYPPVKFIRHEDAKFSDVLEYTMKKYIFEFADGDELIIWSDDMNPYNSKRYKFEEHLGDFTNTTEFQKELNKRKARMNESDRRMSNRLISSHGQ